MPHTSLDQIAAAVADEYDLLAELGRTAAGAAFLAREHASQDLAVLFVPPSGDEVAVLAALGEDVPAGGGRCTRCGHVPATWTERCPGCGNALTGAGGVRFPLDDVSAATSHAYDVLGAVEHQGGATLFFARDLFDGRIVALAAMAHAPDEHVLEAVWETTTAAPRPRTAGAPAGDAGGSAMHGALAGTDATLAGSASAGFAAEEYEAAGGAPYDPASDAVYAGGHHAGGEGRPRRRRWLPWLASALLLVGAGIGYLTWDREELRADPPAAGAPTLDSAQGTTGGDAVPAPPPPPPIEAPVAAPTTGDGAGTAPPPDGPEETAEPSVVQITGDLPPNWSRTVDGRQRSNQRRVVLPPGSGVVTLRFEAPGYCPDSLRVRAASGVARRWSPRLSAAPLVGECGEARAPR